VFFLFDLGEGTALGQDPQHEQAGDGGGATLGQ
jgi:hypothetical protein